MLTPMLPLNAPIGTIHNLATFLDRAAPFVPLFVVPYLLILPIFVVIILFAYWNKLGFRPLVYSIIIIWLVSALTYTLFQTHIVRPQVVGQDFASNLVRFAYTHHRPYNRFPSLHVAMATLITLYAYYTKSKTLPYVMVFSTLVISSTVLIKQHYLLDIVGGIVLTVGIANVVFSRFDYKATHHIE